MDERDRKMANDSIDSVFYSLENNYKDSWAAPFVVCCIQPNALIQTQSASPYDGY